ncbi:MAG: hypothetical protein ACRENP_15995, partial [Longimicrobiales bacterium]
AVKTSFLGRLSCRWRATAQPLERAVSTPGQFEYKPGPRLDAPAYLGASPGFMVSADVATAVPTHDNQSLPMN